MITGAMGMPATDMFLELFGELKTFTSQLLYVLLTLDTSAMKFEHIFALIILSFLVVRIIMISFVGTSPSIFWKWTDRFYYIAAIFGVFIATLGLFYDQWKYQINSIEDEADFRVNFALEVLRSEEETCKSLYKEYNQCIIRRSESPIIDPKFVLPPPDMVSPKLDTCVNESLLESLEACMIAEQISPILSYVNDLSKGDERRYGNEILNEVDAKSIYYKYHGMFSRNYVKSTISEKEFLMQFSTNRWKAILVYIGLNFQKKRYGSLLRVTDWIVVVSDSLLFSNSLFSYIKFGQREVRMFNVYRIFGMYPGTVLETLSTQADPVFRSDVFEVLDELRKKWERAKRDRPFLVEIGTIAPTLQLLWPIALGAAFALRFARITHEMRVLRQATAEPRREKKASKRLQARPTQGQPTAAATTKCSSAESGPNNLTVYGILLRAGSVLVAAERIGGHDVVRFPGGAAKVSETPEAAVIREFLEDRKSVV